MGFYWGMECDGAPQRLLDFVTTVNMWDLAGCLFISASILLSPCLLVTLKTSLKCYCLCFGWHFG